MKFEGGGVMVWGAISARGTGMLKTITGTLNSEGYLGILVDYLIPTAHMLSYGARFYLQDDGAPCHRSRLVTDWKSEQTSLWLIWHLILYILNINHKIILPSCKSIKVSPKM